LVAQPAVQALGLVKRFGTVQALAGVDLQVPAGGVLGLLGPNGAGKTTAVRILTTLLPPDGGSAAEGTSVLLTTQYLEEADRLADQIAVLDQGRVIATGTAAQLKAQVGGDRLELTTPPGTDPQPLAAAMAGLGTGQPQVDEQAGTVVIPVADGPGVLPEVAARLSAADLRVSDLALRRPSLDDVFLTLTGQQPPDTATPTPQRVAGGRAQ
jgi:ABC-2 type transport system ATP-binding protein